MSFIGDLLRRHPDFDGPWPGEKLLTDATAAMLREIDGLAEVTLAAAFHLDGSVAAPAIDIATEQPAGGLKRIDLQVEVEDDFLLWVEIKDWAPESGDSQLATYLEALKARKHTNKRLVYLTRVGAHRRPVADVDYCNWDFVGRSMESWLRENESTLTRGQAWLGFDFVEFLKERGLLSSEPIPPNLGCLLDGFRRAQDILGRLQKLVDERLEGDPNDPRWQRPADQRSLSAHLARGWWKWPLEYWSAFEPTPRERYRGCYFEWGLRGWHTKHMQSPSFYAGVSYWNDDDNDPLKEPRLRARADRIAREHGLIELFGEPGEFTDVTSAYALYRQLPLSVLGGCDSLGEQAERLAEFVNATFEVLRDAPG